MWERRVRPAVTRKTVLVPGGRDVRATLDVADGATSDRVVVACPPHPRRGGTRSDTRLQAVSDALGRRDVDCLRIDYGPWDGGHGERADAGRAVGWATSRYDGVGLFGYSFGAAVALLAAGACEGLLGVSVLAPPPRLDDELDVVAALDAVRCAVQVVYGERDGTVDWRPVVERAARADHDTVSVGADHTFSGDVSTVGERVATFLAERE